ncbi:helix-turn-helix domain-containing protein [Macrococcus equipercicus]|uniref:Helix-turn-helix domain-containing protein n=1 Tax=Macrococcus equipercicus TaxID=69967 RepID=A0A9Q9BM21_9STAP|nr:helix-turn-helix domain-containing protein [Macrococcus equipercicus]UTH13020.1 helix-turn-helix domain-containing protein [Macrococcus equipercicus]
MTKENNETRPFEERYGYIFQSVTRNRNLDIEAKALFSYLASFAGKGDTAFPGVDLICHELNISEKRFKKYRKQLQDHGYLIVNRHRKDKGFSNNVYTLISNPVSGQFVPLQNDTITERPLSKQDDETVSGQFVPEQFVPEQNDPPKKNSLKNNNLNKKNSAINSALDEEFNEWWDLYNKKLDKKPALTKFKAARKKHSFEQIMQGTKAYLKTVTNKQYQKYAKTFLQNECYLEDYSQVTDYNNQSSNTETFNITDLLSEEDER